MDTEPKSGSRAQFGMSTVAYPKPFTTIPKNSIKDKIGLLSSEQLKQFYEEGYCVVRDYFIPDELQPCRDAVGALVEELAQKLFKAGRITKLYEEYGVFQRLTKLEEAYPGANILLFKQGKLPEAFMELWSCEKLVNMAEQFLGPDVAGHPVWNLRVKTPHNEATTVPWHQDSAYFCEKSYDHMILTAWIPFLDTNAHNGGMQMVRRSHRKGKVARHTCCHLGFWYVMMDESDIENQLDVNLADDIVTCEVPYGGMLLFNNLTVHRSLGNVSNDVRWSVDLRWQSPRENWGFYDIAPGILFRSSTQPDIKPDWQAFLKVNRKEEWQKRYKAPGSAQDTKEEDAEDDEFDLTVTGPWIGRWEIDNENVHTRAFAKVTGARVDDGSAVGGQ